MAGGGPIDDVKVGRKEESLMVFGYTAAVCAPLLLYASGMNPAFWDTHFSVKKTKFLTQANYEEKLGNM